MQDTMQIFENQEFGQLGVLMVDGKPHFPATECAETLGYSTPRHAISRHCKGGMKRAVLTNGGVQTINFIPEGDLYRLIIRSKLPAAERFEKWVFDEVLPTIRKHGAYISEEVLRRMQEDSEFNAELLRNLTAEQKRNTVLVGKVAQLAPKAMYHDIILRCPDAVQVSIIAKDYGMSAVAFNKLLYRLRVQYRIGRTWLLYQNYQGNGYTVTNTYTKNGMVDIVGYPAYQLVRPRTVCAKAGICRRSSHNKKAPFNRAQGVI